MKKEFVDTLRLQYPKVLINSSLDFPIGDGWYYLVSDLCDVIESYLKYQLVKTQADYYLVQIKQKFGSLRFYMSETTPYIDGAIQLAELQSARICEECGLAARQVNVNGWIRALCFGHARIETLDKAADNLAKIWPSKKED